MMYGLRKIWEDGIHHGFHWPLEVGAIAKCPDWNPEPVCGGGLHILPEGVGNYFLLEGDYWCVVEFDEEKMVRIGIDKAKVPECKIVYLSETPDGLKDFFDFNKFDPETIYRWAYRIGDRAIMRDKITDSHYAYLWACNIGDKNIMRDRITESAYAYYWAINKGDVEIMRNKVTEPYWKEKFNSEFGEI